MDVHLSDLQAWFQRQMTAIDPAAEAEVDRIIEPSLLRTSKERLSVYQNAYVARLVECLQAEFPAVRHAVGDEVFLQFAAAHLQRHPPHSYTLGQLGAEFAETLQSLRPARETADPDFADFLIELAGYERVVSEVFDAEGPERTPGLEYSVLSRIAPETLVACGIDFFPCVRLVQFRFPVHEYSSAVRGGEDVTPPVARNIDLVVHRRDYTVRRWEALKWQFAILEALQGGASINRAVQAGAEQRAAISPEDLSSAFQMWAAAQLFRGVTSVPPDSPPAEPNTA